MSVKNEDVVFVAQFDTKEMEGMSDTQVEALFRAKWDQLGVSVRSHMASENRELRKVLRIKGLVEIEG